MHAEVPPKIITWKLEASSAARHPSKQPNSQTTDQPKQTKKMATRGASGGTEHFQVVHKEHLRSDGLESSETGGKRTRRAGWWFSRREDWPGRLGPKSQKKKATQMDLLRNECFSPQAKRGSYFSMTGANFRKMPIGRESSLPPCHPSWSGSISPLGLLLATTAASSPKLVSLYDSVTLRLNISEYCVLPHLPFWFPCTPSVQDKPLHFVFVAALAPHRFLSIRQRVQTCVGRFYAGVIGFVFEISRRLHVVFGPLL